MGVSSNYPLQECYSTPTMFQRFGLKFVNTCTLRRVTSGCSGSHYVRRFIQSLVTINGKELAITWPDGAQNSYNAVWLRHNCECSECRQPHTGQKVMDVTELSPNLSISSDGATGINGGLVGVCI